jgi:tripartite-type tricarboxylate transporter receptor subunit TctC
VRATTGHAAAAPLSRLSYDPVKGFAPISIVSASPQVVIAHPSLPAKSLKELIELAKAQRGNLSYASMSIGFGQLTAERFVRMGLKVDMVRVPFQGAAPLLNSTWTATTCGANHIGAVRARLQDGA